MENEKSGSRFWQQIIMQILSAGMAGFLGTYVGIEVVKERIINLGDRVTKIESKVQKLEDAQSAILQAQVQSLTQQLDTERKRRR